ncbi:MAG: NAD(P)/FAD-dependent oxidoreductase [bacterium]|nr:NAD(P)/FAD-dependent oxidoreductase [bacterium]
MRTVLRLLPMQVAMTYTSLRQPVIAVLLDHLILEQAITSWTLGGAAGDGGDRGGLQQPAAGPEEGGGVTGASADLVVAGAGPAGVYAAIRCRELAPAARVIVLERGREPLRKVLISGGGRCNVTNVRTDPRGSRRFYPARRPRPDGPLPASPPPRLPAWFARPGDVGCAPSPTAASSGHRLLAHRRRRPAARRRGTRAWNCRRAAASLNGPRGRRRLRTGDRRRPLRRRAVAATPAAAAATPAGPPPRTSGHTVAPVPLALHLRCRDPRPQDPAGIAFTDAEVRLAGTKHRRRGPLLVTTTG